MSYGSDPMGAALDRYITGNYGEDQFRGEEAWEAMVDGICGKCQWQRDCQVYEDNEMEEKCPIFKRRLKEEVEAKREADEAMMEQMAEAYREMEEK